jgi:hypothetical protein
MAEVGTMDQCPSKSMMEGDMAGKEVVLLEVEWFVMLVVVTSRSMCLRVEPDMVGTRYVDVKSLPLRCGC